MNEAELLESFACVIEEQAAELGSSRERLEALEDLRDLRDAIIRNAGQPLHSWEDVRAELGLTDEEFALAEKESRAGSLESYSVLRLAPLPLVHASSSAV